MAVAEPRFDCVFLIVFFCCISRLLSVRFTSCKTCEPGPGIVMGALAGNRSQTKPCPPYAE